MFPLESMGETGENVAEEFQVSRADQDAMAIRSQQRAGAAIASGYFAEEITPVSVPGGKAGPIVLSVSDTQKKLGDLFVHMARVTQGTLRVGDHVHLVVDGKRRDWVMGHWSPNFDRGGFALKVVRSGPGRPAPPPCREPA